MGTTRLLRFTAKNAPICFVMFSLLSLMRYICQSVFTRNEIASFPATNDSGNLKLAYCVTGQMRTLAVPSYVEKFQQSFFHPLKYPQIKVDAFFFLDDTLDARNLTLVQKLQKVFEPIVLVVEKVECEGSWCDNAHCSKHGYTMYKRYADCMDAVKKHEERIDATYDFVVRIRPDVLFIEGIPEAKCWKNLRRDIIWIKNPKFKKHAKLASADSLILAKDYFEILPRNTAEAFIYGIRDEYLNCITAQTTLKFGFMGCGERNKGWSWHECRTTRSLFRMNATVGALERNAVLVRCQGEKDGRCSDIHLWHSDTSHLVPDLRLRTTCFEHEAYSNARD